MTTHSPLTVSPLHSVHTGLKAQFTDFAGWNMPVRYSSELAEHKAVREAAGIFDLSHMGEITVSGPEAELALDHALIGNLSGVAVGRARYSMLCHDTGGVLDDLVVYRLAEDEFMVVANASNVAVVATELRDRSHGFGVQVVDRSAEYALIAVQGPKSPDIIGAVCDADLAGLKYYAGVPAGLTGVDGRRHELLLARTGYTGEDGFELYVAPDEATDVWAALTAAGAPHGLLPAGLACRDTLRLEAGMPLYGHELTVHRTPFEANMGRLVKFEKPGDFVGKAALAKRRDAIEADGPEKVLVGLRGEGRRAPRAGYRVLDGAGTEIGEVTSGALAPTLGYPIAMAYVPPAFREPGTKLAVDIRGKAHDVEVVATPFYKRA